MVIRSAGHVPWALVLVAIASVAASGQGLASAQAARNETAASPNEEALDALLSTTSRAFSKSECVESIRIMKQTWRKGSYPEIEVSVPMDNAFIPPGAEAWCTCLQDNEPTRGIPSDFEGVFDTCRDQVLVNSDYNAMDICRGMVLIYGYNFWYFYTTFCSRELCASRDEFDDYNPGWFYYQRDAFDLQTDCSGRCMRELSAGYCAKHRLTYGGWVFETGYSLRSTIWRRINVDGNTISTQDAFFNRWGSGKVEAAQKICDLLYPTDQGRCCTYERGYATLSQCCYVKNGALEFNCAKSYGGDRLRYNCAKLGYRCTYMCQTTYMPTACNVLIDYYVAHSTYQQAKLVRLPGGQTSVVFPEAFMDEFCVSSEFYDLRADNVPNDFTPGTREYCCAKLNAIFRVFVENCLPGAGSYTSLGATRLQPSVTGPQPTPPTASCDACSYVDDKGDCKSVCKSTEECAARNGKAFCVRCDYFRQDFPDGKNRQCCELRDGDSGPLCKTKVNNKGEKNKCFTNDGPWTNNKGVERNPQPYTIDAVQNVCNSKENFRVNRKLCKVKNTANGRKECKYITDKQRDKILAGR